MLIKKVANNIHGIIMRYLFVPPSNHKAVHFFKALKGRWHKSIIAPCPKCVSAIKKNMIQAPLISFCFIPIPVNFPLHIFTPDRIHGMQFNRIVAFSFDKPVDKLYSVSAIEGVITQIMVTVDFVNNSIFFFALDYLFFVSLTLWQ